ncbi:Clp amino terminal domain-containing protein, pathogenicity island component [Thermomonospora echinospora]|uniref:Clp amino terminal domain-containing protein, pathogenicity island component n=1 Tax=Thermomonospora echinospora TaxID=1992 RepID=A0A1H6DF63_9ACTN|nr:Clp protease N-terminal domain-containing protein [Thermomonospora echinospora]SEG83860.1 Clp amino terminal domain-containing protein, pathogenicity island component [Thermomonospora echinospora]
MVLPDLDALIAGIERACDHACQEAGQQEAGQEQPDRIARLKAAAATAEQLRGLADDLVESYVEHCRLHGHSWTQIGTALGVTRQAAQQRYLAPHRTYEPGEFAEEICTAVAHMKETAVQHRNNFIGTEHVLCGLLAENNSAVRLLASLGVSADSLRQRIQGSLTMGASQAAKRIAWTPYTRKALATAYELAAEDEGPVSCKHLLLGVASLGRGTAATALAEASVGHSTPARTRSRPSESVRRGH